MAKLTINEKDYYTDDFNEDQMKMYHELSLAREEMGRMDYLMRVLDGRCTQLGSMILEIAEQNEVKQLQPDLLDEDKEDDK